MAINFPNSPGIGSVFTDATAGFSYEWDGVVWKSYAAASSSNIKVLDDISGSFNGSTLSFPVTSSSVSITPANAQSLIINLGGVVQDSSDDYSVSGSNIVFSTAPSSGLTFSGVSLGPAVAVNYANNGNIYSRYAYTAGAGQTDFSVSGGYTVVSGTGYLDVYRNGVRLRSGSDYVGTSGTGFVLTDAAIANDELEAIAYNVASIVDASTSMNNLNVTGITTTNRLNVSTNAVVTGIITATSAIVGTGVTLNASGVNVTGVVTASSFVGNGSGLTGAGSTVFNDITTNQEFFPLFTSTISGTITSSGISTSKLTYNPSTGAMTAVDFNSTSDKNLKTNIHTVKNALETIEQLRGVSFDWKETDKSSYGVIAQELEEVLPELVKTGEVKSVNYNGIIGVLIEAVKELKAEIEELKNTK